MLNIYSTKTVSSLVVYLTFDEFRYDCNDYVQVTMNSVTDYIDTIAFFASSMYYCSCLYVLTHVTHVTTHVTVCVI